VPWEAVSDSTVADGPDCDREADALVAAPMLALVTISVCATVSPRDTGSGASPIDTDRSADADRMARLS
jgi:hypothetical protein